MGNGLVNISPRHLVSSTTGKRCPENVVDQNGDLFSGRYAYRQSLSLRIENRCQLPIVEVYSEKLQLTFIDINVGRSVENLKIIYI